jgi:hypothetical protein
MPHFESCHRCHRLSKPVLPVQALHSYQAFFEYDLTDKQVSTMNDHFSQMQSLERFPLSRTAHFYTASDWFTSSSVLLDCECYSTSFYGQIRRLVLSARGSPIGSSSSFIFEACRSYLVLHVKPEFPYADAINVNWGFQ